MTHNTHILSFLFRQSAEPKAPTYCLFSVQLLFWMEKTGSLKIVDIFYVLIIPQAERNAYFINTYIPTSFMFRSILYHTEVFLSSVVSVCQSFAVLEDGVLAHNLQEQESEYNVKLQTTSLCKHLFNVGSSFTYPVKGFSLIILSSY